MAANKSKQHIFEKELYPDKFRKSVLSIFLLEKHPFHNTTKRKAFLATYVFLKLNGYSIKMENQ